MIKDLDVVNKEKNDSDTLSNNTLNNTSLSYSSSTQPLPSDHSFVPSVLSACSTLSDSAKSFSSSSLSAPSVSSSNSSTSTCYSLPLSNSPFPSPSLSAHSSSLSLPPSSRSECRERMKKCQKNCSEDAKHEEKERINYLVELAKKECDNNYDGFGLALFYDLIKIY